MALQSWKFTRPVRVRWWSRILRNFSRKWLKSRKRARRRRKRRVLARTLIAILVLEPACRCRSKPAFVLASFLVGRRNVSHQSNLLLVQLRSQSKQSKSYLNSVLDAQLLTMSYLHRANVIRQDRTILLWEHCVRLRSRAQLPWFKNITIQCRGCKRKTQVQIPTAYDPLISIFPT